MDGGWRVGGSNRGRIPSGMLDSCLVPAQKSYPHGKTKTDKSLPPLNATTAQFLSLTFPGRTQNTSSIP